MKIITINLPMQYIDAIRVLTDLELYASRSEAIRVALRNFLSKELENFHSLNVNEFKMLITSRGVIS